MSGIVRVLLALYLSSVTYYFLGLLIGLYSSSNYTSIISSIVAVASGWGVWQYSSNIHSEKGLASFIAYGVIISGSIGMIYGFFVPIMMEQGSAQAPLAGLLVVAPIASILGGVVGVIVWLAKKNSIEGTSINRP